MTPIRFLRGLMFRLYANISSFVIAVAVMAAVFLGLWQLGRMIAPDSMGVTAPLPAVAVGALVLFMLLSTRVDPVEQSTLGESRCSAWLTYVVLALVFSALLAFCGLLLSIALRMVSVALFDGIIDLAVYRVPVGDMAAAWGLSALVAFAVGAAVRCVTDTMRHDAWPVAIVGMAITAVALAAGIAVAVRLPNTLGGAQATLIYTGLACAVLLAATDLTAIRRDIRR